MAIKRYQATKDNTITNAYRSSLIDTQRGTGSNMGAADVVEIFSIYGEASGSDGLSAELSRAILEFPVSTISTDRIAGTLPASGSVTWHLKMFNARHAFTLPRQFNLLVQPIGNPYAAASWEEGVGLDMEEYKDVTYNNSGSNWIRRGDVAAWVRAGGDFLTGATDPSYNVSFPKGYENLTVDITGMVEGWLENETGSTGRPNYGLAVYLTGSQEAYFSSSVSLPAGASGTGSQGSLLYNVQGATESYYTKKFFARSSEFFFKRPVLEARWDSRITDDRGSFYISSSLAPAADNLNTLHLYNYVRGQLVDIPGVAQGEILVSIYSGTTAPADGKLNLPIGGNVAADGDFNVTGGWHKTGIYTASFAATGTLTKFFDVWHSPTALTSPVEYWTGSLAPKTLTAYNNAPTNQYVTSISNLKSSYMRSSTARFRTFIREKDWSPTIYTVATSTLSNTSLTSASYKIFRVADNLEVVPYGTGSTYSTYLSYDVSGNYFDLNIGMLEADYLYGIKFAYYNGSIGDWVEQPEEFKFRVEEG
tara:strand:- start:1238 stop:2842 length:1605 start_codon:yes stop_codon:yes gene_type:complete